MSNLRRIPYTKPLPPDAEVLTRKGKRFARYKDSKGRPREAPLTEDGARIRLLSKKYYGEYKDADGAVQCVPLSTDETAAKQMLSGLEKGVERVRSNIVTSEELASASRTMAEHLDDFHKALLADNNTEKHARQTVNRDRKLAEGCKFVFIADVQASRVTEWLADERNAGRLSITTSNYYLRDRKSFFVWLVKDRRIGTNPLAHLKRLNEEIEDHRQRRTLEADEYRRLLAAAQAGPTRARLDGPDRFMLYTPSGPR